MANGTTHSQGAAIRPDDANRKPTVADPDDPRLCQPAIAGGTYTTLVTGEQTAGRYCLTDMQVHASGAGEEVFMAVGDPVDSAAAPPPTLSGTEPIARVQRAKALSARFERNRWCDGLAGKASGPAHKIVR